MVASFKITGKVEGLSRLQARLEGLGSRGRKASAAKVKVGYAKPYAIFVHENMEAKHPTGQAKFLETPARQLHHELAAIVYRSYKQNKDMVAALLQAGLFLKEQSQKLVPVLTGALRDSAFAKVER